MRRKFLTMFCALALTAGLLAGCTSKTETKEETKTEDTKDSKEPVSEEEAEAAGFTDGAEEGEAADAENTEESADEEGIISESAGLDTSSPLSGTHHAEIVIKDYGTIELELDADTAPITVTNFVKLAQDGFYDGLTFHRIMEGFMMQGGDPLGNGRGGSDESIKGEFAQNGVENNISHKRGVISMARAQDPDSGSSQFFIVHADSEFLDGGYAAFGEVTEGMDVVDKICEESKPIDNNGTIPSDKQPVMESVTILD